MGRPCRNGLVRNLPVGAAVYDGGCATLRVGDPLIRCRIPSLVPTDSLSKRHPHQAHNRVIGAMSHKRHRILVAAHSVSPFSLYRNHCRSPRRRTPGGIRTLLHSASASIFSVSASWSVTKLVRSFS